VENRTNKRRCPRRRPLLRWRSGGQSRRGPPNSCSAPAALGRKGRVTVGKERVGVAVGHRGRVRVGKGSRCRGAGGRIGAAGVAGTPEARQGGSTFSAVAKNADQVHGSQLRGTLRNLPGRPANLEGPVSKAFREARGAWRRARGTCSDVKGRDLGHLRAEGRRPGSFASVARSFASVARSSARVSRSSASVARSSASVARSSVGVARNLTPPLGGSQPSGARFGSKRSGGAIASCSERADP